MSVEPDDSTQPESDDISPSGPRLLRMDRIKNRIVLVALLATLIPSIGTAWVSYLQNKRALTEKITEELAAGSSQAARELDLWIEQRISPPLTKSARTSSCCPGSGMNRPGSGKLSPA
jgi:hypothetical protein